MTDALQARLKGQLSMAQHAEVSLLAKRVVERSAFLSVDNQIVGPLSRVDPALRFGTDEVLWSMGQSPIGRTVADAARGNAIDLVIADTHPQGWKGMNIPGTSRAITYVENNAVLNAAGQIDRAASLQAVGSNAVHEGLHALGIRGSWQAEVQVRALTFEHQFGRVATAQELAQIEAVMRNTGAYNNLPRTLGKRIEIMPGRFIDF